MRERLTERQNQVFEFIRDAVRRNGKPPTIKEIGQGLGMRSSNGVHKMLVVLERKGYINRIPNEARGLEVVGEEGGYGSDEPPGVLMLKLKEGVGRRARLMTSETADHPLPRSRRPLLVDPSLLPDDVDLDFCIGVVASDDGMNGVGIYKGDLVVVEEAGWRDIKDGSLAAVLFYDRVVIRRFAHVNGRLQFRAADRSYSDETVRPDDPEFFVIGQALVMTRKL
ncbi:LexA family protein [Rubrivirga sp.]|uniref:LexA family protein n=1 Tax=Rubrivirga sp. TaxID=1885344 RepID=UPI003C776A23